MLRKLLFTSAMSIVTLAASAQFSGDGYYRVYNIGMNTLKNKKCYVTMTADRVVIVDQAGTGQNFPSIELWQDSKRSFVSDPGAVIYATMKNGSINLAAQGTSVSEMTSREVKLTQNGKANSYMLSSYDSGVTLYLWASTTYSAKHYIVTTISNPNVAYKFWAVEPVSSTADSFFGVKPTLEVDGKYYAPFYASFPFKFASKGMKAYYVSSVNNEHFTLDEITSEVIPGSTPMLIECSSVNPSDNRLELLYGDYGKVNGNKLSGVYFCNDFFEDSNGIRTEFDANTMRVWNVQDGKLVLSTATDNLHSSYYAGKTNFPNELFNGYLNANQSYLKVSSTANTTLTLGTTGIEEIGTSAEAAKPVSYITVGGVRVDAPKKGMGMVVVKYSDGTARTVVY